MNKSPNLKKSIVKNSFWSFSATFINRMGSLIFTIILARFLMPEKYGIYSIVMSVAMILFTFSDLGVNQTLVRYVSLVFSSNKPKGASYYFYLLKLKFILTSGSALVLLLLAYPLSEYIFKNPLLFLPLLIVSGYIFIFSFEGFYAFLFYSIEKVKYVSIREFLSQFTRIFFVLFVIYFMSSTNQIVWIILALTLSSLIVLIFCFYFLKKIVPQLFKKTNTQINKREVRKFVIYLTITSISGIFFSYVDSIMLGIFLLPEYVGFYRAAFSLIYGIIGFISFPILLLLAIFTKLNSKKTKKVFEQAFRYLAIITIPSIFGLIILGRFFIKLFYGAAYLPSTLLLYILSPLIFIIVSINVLLSLFSAKGKPQIFAKLAVISSILNIILNFIFIKLFLLISPLWATAGAAIATLISWIFYFLILVYHIKKDLKFSISFNFLIRPLFSAIIMFFSLYFLISQFTNINLFLGIFFTLEGVLVYVVMMLLIKGIKREEFELIKQLIYR